MTAQATLTIHVGNICMNSETPNHEMKQAITLHRQYMVTKCSTLLFLYVWTESGSSGRRHSCIGFPGVNMNEYLIVE